MDRFTKEKHVHVYNLWQISYFGRCELVEDVGISMELAGQITDGYGCPIHKIPTHKVDFTHCNMQSYAITQAQSSVECYSDSHGYIQHKPGAQGDLHTALHWGVLQQTLYVGSRWSYKYMYCGHTHCTQTVSMMQCWIQNTNSYLQMVLKYLLHCLFTHNLGAQGRTSAVYAAMGTLRLCPCTQGPSVFSKSQLTGQKSWSTLKTVLFPSGTRHFPLDCHC